MLTDAEREARNEANKDWLAEHKYRTRRPLNDDGTLDLDAVYENLQHLQDDEAVDYLVQLDVSPEEYYELRSVYGRES